MNKTGHFIQLPVVMLILLVGNGIVCALPYRETASNVSVQESPLASETSLNTDIPKTLQPSPTLASTKSIAPSTTQGPTIQHRVAVGEWLLQIARCYGADLASLRKANPQITDSNTSIVNTDVVTVPNVGSAGKVYGPPCVTFYTVQDGDTWTSIAQRFNADVGVLQKINPITLSAGITIKVPLNSADPVPFTFQEGSLQEQSTLSPKETLNYEFKATKGDRLTIRLQDSSNRIALRISGIGLALNLQDLEQAWSVTIPSAGMYIISVANTLATTEAVYQLLVQRLVVASTPVVSTATDRAGEPMEQKIAQVTEAIGQFTMANIAYNLPPETMQLDETLTMELLLNPSVDSEVLASQISENGPLQTATIKITDQVKAELIQEAEGFTIKPFRDDPEQPIGKTENTKWTWYVTAKTPGKHKLTLIIHRLVLVDGEERWIEAGTAYKSDIHVKVTLAQRFQTLDWKWIFAPIITLLLIPAFWRWYDNRKKQASAAETTEPNKKPKRKPRKRD